MDDTENHEVVVDFGNICRLCLCEDRVESYLYEEANAGAEGYNLAGRIESLTGVKVSLDDGYPTYICEGCVNHLDTFTQFISSCRRAQETLTQSYVQALVDAGFSSSAIDVVLTKNKEADGKDDMKRDGNSDETKKNLKLVGCASCSQWFGSDSDLFEHKCPLVPITQVKEEDQQVEEKCEPDALWCHICNLCGEKYWSSTNSSFHVGCTQADSKSGDTRHMYKPATALCKYCGATRGNVTLHLENVHKITKEAIIKTSESGNFDCRLCLRPFMRHSALRLHIEKVHGDDLDTIAESENCQVVWSCTECPLMFPGEVQLIQHCGSKHSKYPADIDMQRIMRPKDTVCQCGVVSVNQMEAQVHKVLYHDDDVTAMQCPLCPCICQQVSELKKHIIGYHWFINTSAELECVLCGCEFDLMESLRQHISDEHQVVLSRRSDGSKLERRHKNMRLQNVASHSCSVCSAKFPTTIALIEHGISCQAKPNTVYHACSTCGKVYKSESHLKRHMMAFHQADGPVVCPQCPKVFPRKLNLHNHYKRRHLQQTKRFVCSFCGHTLKGKAALRSHEDRLHRNVRSFKCSECPEAFTTLEILRKHAQRHMAQRPMHECSQCDKKFTTVSGYDRHVKTHGGVKEFVCDIQMCSKSFYTKFELSRHVKFHNKDFKYECSVCKHRFMAPGELKKHSTKHTGDRPYKCHICHSAYARRDDKVKHLKRVHNLKVKRTYGKPLRRFSEETQEEHVDTVEVVEDESNRVMIDE